MDLDADEVEVEAAEGLDAGEVFQGAFGGGVGEWFVDAEVVAVGMEQIDGFGEGLHGLAQGGDEVGEAGAAVIGAFVLGQGIGLHEEDEGAVLGFGGFGKGVLHPGDGGGVAGEEFGHGGGVAFAGVIVAADDVEGGKQDAAAGPAIVLDVGGKGGGEGALAGELEGGGAEALVVGGEKQAAHEGEAIERVKPSGIGGVAVGPFVVAGDIDEGVLELIEPSLDLGIDGVIAGFLAAFGIAAVNAESGFGGVGGGDDVLKAGFILRHVVGHAAHDQELEGFGFGTGGGAEGKEEGEGGEEAREHGGGGEWEPDRRRERWRVERARVGHLPWLG